ncbi:MAG: GHKL domain-containing protein [Lachnospiraceae bacterium]|nr:GHKL domain-containing protein [Lachnospiraceae bacterium]
MESINIWLGAMACCFDAIIMLWFVTNILAERREMKWWGILPFFVFLFADGFLLGDNLVLQILVFFVILLLYERFILKGRFWEQLIIALITLVVITLVNCFVFQLVAVLSGYDTKQLMQIQGIPQILMVLLDKIALFITFFIVIRVVHVEQKMKHEEEMITIILFLAVFVNGIVSVAMIENKENDTWEAAGLLVINILQIGIAVLIHYLLNGLRRQRKLKEENAILSMQIYEQENRLRQTEELYQTTRKMRHDMKRYFTTYLELLEAGKTEMVIEDLCLTLKNRLPARQVVYTSNQIINAVINDKMRRCQEQDIQFDIQITDDIPDKSEMDDAIILSNLLDNAIEAEEKIQDSVRRKISLKIFCYKGMLNLIVRNYIESSVLEVNPAMRTTKMNKFYHGIGIDSVREMVKCQKGEIDFAEEDSYFVAHILLPKENSEERIC